MVLLTLVIRVGAAGTCTWEVQIPAGLSRFLLHSDRYTAHGGRQLGADPTTTELQDDAIGVLQLRAPCAAGDRTARAGYDIAAGKIAGASQVQRPAHELTCGGADRKAQAHARNREGILLPTKGKYTLAATDIDDKTALGKYDAHPAGVSEGCRCKTRQQQ